MVSKSIDIFTPFKYKIKNSDEDSHISKKKGNESVFLKFADLHN